MKRLILIAFVTVSAALAQGCGWCCGCTTTDSEAFLLLFARGEAPAAQVQYVSAEQLMELR